MSSRLSRPYPGGGTDPAAAAPAAGVTEGGDEGAPGDRGENLGILAAAVAADLAGFHRDFFAGLNSLRRGP